MLNDKFDVIYCDPPWRYEAAPYFKKSLAVQYQYDTMESLSLESLDVSRIAAKNCWLFMWVVWAELKNAINLIESWGFKYKTAAFVWAKKTKNGKNAKTFGRCCTQGSTEIVLAAKRGAPKRYALNVEQFLEAEVRGHSVKPDEVYGLIDKIVDPSAQTPNLKKDACLGAITDCPNYNDGCWCHIAGAPPVKKIELFARRPKEGWYSLGNDEALNIPDNPMLFYGDIRELVGIK